MLRLEAMCSLAEYSWEAHAAAERRPSARDGGATVDDARNEIIDQSGRALNTSSVPHAMC